MKVKMLKSLRFPEERMIEGQEYEVSDEVGSKWVRRGLAAAVEVVVDRKSGSHKSGPRRPTTEE